MSFIPVVFLEVAPEPEPGVEDLLADVALQVPIESSMLLILKKTPVGANGTWSERATDAVNAAGVTDRLGSKAGN